MVIRCSSRSHRYGGSASGPAALNNGTLENYASIILGQSRAPFVPALLNSLQIALITVIVALFFRLPCGARRDALPFPGPRVLHNYHPDLAA